MSFLKRDMNLKLVFLILVLVVAITTFSVFYQNKLQNISHDYKNKTQLLEKVTAKAVSEEAKAGEISQIKEKLEEDKESLEKGYNELKDENLALKQDLDEIRSELQSTKSQLQEKTRNFDLLQTRFNQVEESLINANEEISRLAVRVRKLCK